MPLIAIELCKLYLYRALRYEVSDSDSIYCLANVYLAVLHYTTGQYHTAIDHCTLVTRLQDHSQCSSRVVQGKLLPKVDDNVDHVLGLAVLYKRLRKNAFNQHHQTHYVGVLTPELFANYLVVTMFRRFTQKLSTDEFKRYKIVIVDTPQLFVVDVLLFLLLSQSVKQKCYHKPVYQQPPQRTERNTSDLVELLQKSAVEHLTIFRRLQARDFGSVSTTVTTDFEALYAYKRGDYQRCLQLSIHNVHTLLYAANMHAANMPHVLAFPEFIHLLDDGIASLTALIRMAQPKYRQYARSYVCIDQLTLSLYLMTHCQLKLRHSVTSLAKILDYIEVAQRKSPADWTLNQLTLKLIKRKVVVYVNRLA